MSQSRPLIRIEDPADPRIAGFVSIRERDLTGRDGCFIAEGTVVLRMLASPACRARGMQAQALLLLENRVDGLRDVIAAFDASIPVYVACAAVFDAIAGFHMHRGVLALGKRQDAPDMERLMAGLGPKSLIVAACGISNHDNLGAMFRNAAAFGADAVLLDETSCDPMYRKSIRVSVGSVLTVPFAREGSVEALLSRLQEADFALWGLSPAGETDLEDIPPHLRTALLAGTEGEGLAPKVMASIQTARIRQKPGLDSLNVATATGIALYHVARINSFI